MFCFSGIAQNDVQYPDLVIIKPNKKIRCKIISNTNTDVIFKYLITDSIIKVDTLTYFRIKVIKLNFFTEKYEMEKDKIVETKENVSALFVGFHTQYPIKGREPGFDNSYFPVGTEYADTETRLKEYNIQRVLSYGGGLDYWFTEYRSIRVSGFYSQIKHQRVGEYYETDTTVLSLTPVIIDTISFEDQLSISYVKTEIRMNFTSDFSEKVIGFFGIGSTHYILIDGESTSGSRTLNLKDADVLSPLVVGGIFSIGAVYRYNNLAFNLNIMGELGLTSTTVDPYRPNNYIMINAGVKLHLAN